jgi:hypothetical protein
MQSNDGTTTGTNPQREANPNVHHARPETHQNLIHSIKDHTPPSGDANGTTRIVLIEQHG